MNRDERKRNRKLFKSEEKAVRAILNEWDSIVGSPANEYDYLVHRILSMLHRDGAKAELGAMIQQELVDHFGFGIPEKEIDRVAKKVWDWWSDRSPGAACV
jgi:hypothetical protein